MLIDAHTDGQPTAECLRHSTARPAWIQTMQSGNTKVNKTRFKNEDKLKLKIMFERRRFRFIA